jgi:hypothetical protein
MMRNVLIAALLSVAIETGWAALAPSAAQNQPPAAAPGQENPLEPQYKPPPRGAPGGRVGGACRGTIKPTTPLPTIELLAPDGHAGLSTSASPILYFFVSRPVAWPTQFTISASAIPKPIAEVSIPAPTAAGIYALRTADYNVRLEPGVLYTWSVSLILDPKSPSRDIVASASLLRAAPGPALEATLRTAPPNGRAALFARDGWWYDAVAAAAENAPLDRHAALDALMTQVGLVEGTKYGLQVAGGARVR